MGASTQRFGSLAQWLIQSLNVVTGNLDRPGGAMFTRPAFDAELLRQYAQTRISASYVVMLLVVGTGILFGLWIKPNVAAARR